VHIIESGSNPRTGRPVRPNKDGLERWVEALRLDSGDRKSLLTLAGYGMEKSVESSPHHVLLDPELGKAVVINASFPVPEEVTRQQNPSRKEFETRLELLFRDAQLTDAEESIATGSILASAERVIAVIRLMRGRHD
jgi:hypothetical protein